MSQVFIADHWKVRHGRWLVPVIALVTLVITNLRGVLSGLPTMFYPGAGAFGSGVALYLLSGLVRSRSPIIEISDDTVSGGFLFRYWKRESVRIADIAGVSLIGSRLELRTTVLDTIRFWVGDLSKTTREAARVAIENAVRAQGTAGNRLKPS